MKLSIYFGLFALASVIDGYKILVLGPYNGKSHALFLSEFVKTLLERSHEVTFVTSISMSKDKIANYTEILIDPPINSSKINPQEVLYSGAGDKSPFDILQEVLVYSKYSTDYCLANENVQKLIHRDDLHFDLVINEEFFHDAFSMFGYKFNAPVVTICAYGNSDFFDRQMGLLTPWSHVPHMTVTYTDNMSLTERWYNVILSGYDWILRNFVHYPVQNAAAKKHFGHLPNLPSVQEMNRNVSLILINTHRALSLARPAMPNMINIGGAHVKPPKPLPADLKKFLDGAKDGAIYFSLGTVIKASEMPKEQLNAFLGAFGKIKQRVLWKFEDESLANVPSNVMIKKWLPQNDILAHPNVKAFITHSGLFGTFEALANGIPLIMIPFFGDQYRNSKRVENAGYGKILQFKDITEDSVYEAVQELITNESYSKKAKELEEIFKENLVHPMDEAMWWIEYVAKFKGAKHMKSHAVNMSWFSYLLLDMVIISWLIISTVVLALIVLIVYLFKKVFCNKKCKKRSD